MKKAVVLLSGGLDSTLATKLTKDMGINLTALNFNTVFCTCNKSGCKFESKKVSQDLDIPLKVMSITKEYMGVVREPKFGYGSAMNPCIDCRIFMFKKAKEYMEEIGGSFVVTGEVLGQRPMSQNKGKMDLIEKESGLDGLILRPLTRFNYDKLSAKVKDMVKLDGLPDIRGRSRKEQINLAKEHNIEDYVCASGGCLLTDKDFSVRLKDHFDHNKDDDINHIKLLKVGRHFRLNRSIKLIVARDEAEVKKLNFYKGVGTQLVPDVKGPSALIVGEGIDDGIIELSAKIVGRYCSEDRVGFEVIDGKSNRSFTVKAFTASELEPYWIKR